jgi:hypothetical protein
VGLKEHGDISNDVGEARVTEHDVIVGTARGPKSRMATT